MPVLNTSSRATGRFRIVFTERSKDVVDALAEELETSATRIAARLGRPWQGVTEVRVGFDRDEMEALSPGGRPPSWAVALAFPDAGVVLLEARTWRRDAGKTTLRHELAHIALGRVATGWPRWFQEGMAQELTMERRFSFAHYTTLAQAASSERIFKFADLTQGFPESAADVELAYAQSAAFVAFLHDRHGAEGFGALLDAMTDDATFELAFAKAFHTSLRLEEAAFLIALPKSYPVWPLVTGGTSAWAVLSGLVVVGWVRRRREVAAFRARQEEVEALEDALLAQAERDDLERAGLLEVDARRSELRDDAGVLGPTTVKH